MPLHVAAISPSEPSRTSPELKWLLNERAELTGRAIAYVEHQKQLKAQVMRLEAELEASRTALATCAEAIAKVASLTAAMDVTIQLGFPQANPSAGGAVKAHYRYGERGALTSFLQEHLRLMSPRSSTAAELRRVVMQRFGLVLLTPLEQDRFKGSIRTTLLQIRDRQGTIEAISVGERGQTRWRWKQAPTLDDLRRMVERSSMSEEDPPHERVPHPNKI